MPAERQIMRFLVPLSTKALGRNDTTDRAEVKFYINPENITFTEAKIVQNSLTTGGYVVHYWGEQLLKLGVRGTTGSSGIEGINVLRDVYRHEINQFNLLLNDRAINIQQDFVTAFGTVPGAEGNALNRANNFWDGLKASFKNTWNQGIGDGVKSIIDEISDASQLITDANPASLELVPTLGAFASDIILYWQGEKFQGYFENFGVTEASDSPGVFTYDFNFVVLKRSGKRKNFMPWHRKATDQFGNAVTVSLPKEGAMPEELSIPYTEYRASLDNQPNQIDSAFGNQDKVTSIFSQDQGSVNESNNVGINRNNLVRGR